MKVTYLKGQNLVLVTTAQEKINDYMQASFPNLPVAQIELDRNRKYIRVVKAEQNHGRSVYCFIDKTNGNILKGSWQSPVKNGVRGNIYSGDHGADRVTHHGCAYLR